MESHFGEIGPACPEGPLASSQARDALDRLSADGARLAERMVTPWWYHLVLGMIVALFVGSQVLPGAVPIVLVAVGVVALTALINAYSRRYGISTGQPAGPRSRRLLLAAAGTVALSMAAALVIKFTGTLSWWGLLPAAFAFGATVVLGRRYDDALRGEFARDAADRA